MRRPTTLAPMFTGALLTLATPIVADAQVRASERSSVSQTIDGTVFTIDYARPRARQRQLFGKVIEWGEIWTPGANWATTLDVSRDVTIDGHAVPKGKYSMWFVVQPKQWTMILDPRFKRYHEERPDSTAQQIRWTVTPQDGPFAESLTWSFPDVRPDGTKLLMQWGATSVALDAVVHPSHPLTIARSDIEPYIGAYELGFVDGPNDTPKKMEPMELYYDAGSLKMRFPKPPDWYKMIQGAIMVRINDDWFMPTIMVGNRIYEAVADMIFEFTRKNGRVVRLEIRDDQDNLLAKGTRR